LKINIVLLFIHLLCFGFQPAWTQNLTKPDVKLIPVDSGWASNSINAVAFRKNSLVTWKDTQVIAFYDKGGQVIVGKRKVGSTQWILQRTPFRGNVSDAHNSISIMIDGNGFIHMAWSHHNTQLLYVQSAAPLSLEFSQFLPMTGLLEHRVTYPEFYRMENGNLLFLYRNGESGNGKLVANEYDITRREWSQLHSNLIDGEEKRNAYWQAHIDKKGTIHISWVWRESPDVASNHDLCYARSTDNGRTWEKSNGEKYSGRITATSAEYLLKIPEGSELINQTSMTADEEGNAYIATYWRAIGEKIPQYQVLHQTSHGWQHLTLDFRITPFSLSGGGTKRIPIARPQILVDGSDDDATAFLIFRDEERGQKVSAAIIRKGKWHIVDLTETSVGAWEPTYDTQLWKEKKSVNLFLQFVEQADAEGLVKSTPHLVYVLECKNDLK
jgi:BNR repeat-containing family member